MQAFDIHTHQANAFSEAISIQSFCLTQTKINSLPLQNFISVGLHPWYVNEINFENSFQVLKEISTHENVKMIGECGLDKLRGAPLKNQLYYLEKQLLLAEELKKPVILHCVKAFQELILIKKKLNIKTPLVIHGFNKKQILAEQMLDNGFYLSFGAAILNEHSNASTCLKNLDNFFLETDDSATPIEEIYKHAAILKKCEVEEIKERTFALWKKITDL